MILNKHLLYDEVVKIEKLLREGLNGAEIAVKLKKSPSTIYEVIKRGGGKDNFDVNHFIENTSYLKKESDSLFKEQITEELKSINAKIEYLSDQIDQALNFLSNM